MNRIKIIGKEKIGDKAEAEHLGYNFRVTFKYNGLTGHTVVWLSDEFLEEPDLVIDRVLKGWCLDFAIENYPHKLVDGVIK